MNARTYSRTLTARVISRSRVVPAHRGSFGGRNLNNVRITPRGAPHRMPDVLMFSFLDWSIVSISFVDTSTSLQAKDIHAADMDDINRIIVRRKAWRILAKSGYGLPVNSDEGGREGQAHPAKRKKRPGLPTTAPPTTIPKPPPQ